MLIWLSAAFVAGVLASFGPRVLARLPEPEEPDADKIPYVALAGKSHLGLWLGLGAAIAAGVVAALIDISELVPVWVALSAVGVLLAYVDWHTKLLPRLIVLPLNATVFLLVVFAAAIAGDWTILSRGLVYAAIIFGLFWLSNLLYSRGLGYGDVRMSFGLALALGSLGGSEVFVGIYAGFVLGVIGSLALTRLKIEKAREFAFGPYLLLGGVVGAAWGPAITGLL
ncbi:MAG: A24 family peptidase [Aeromicrobium sp.]